MTANTTERMKFVETLTVEMMIQRWEPYGRYDRLVEINPFPEYQRNPQCFRADLKFSSSNEYLIKPLFVLLGHIHGVSTTMMGNSLQPELREGGVREWLPLFVLQLRDMSLPDSIRASTPPRSIVYEAGQLVKVYDLDSDTRVLRMPYSYAQECHVDLHYALDLL